MALLWQILSPLSKVNLAEAYKRASDGIEFVPPDQEVNERGIECETKLEPIEEIDKIMRQKPKRVI